MTDRVLGTPGKQRRRRLWIAAPLIVLVAACTMLIGASSATALNTDASQYSTQQDQGGTNDVPGQKDLTIQGTNTGDMPTKINVLWNWDDTSVGGGNTLDGCSLFDTDTTGPGVGQADAAFCATVGNVSNGNKTLVLKTETLYTCGDTRPDRCASQIAVVGQSTATECQVELNSDSNPFDASLDTRIFCTVVLADISATNAVLLNTCSYPSQQPNSDPSDCVLIPGKANPSISTTPTLIPQDSATLSSNTNGSVTFELYKDGAVSGTTPNGVCDAGELVFQQTDTSSPFATSNAGGNSLSAYTITTDGTYLWKVHYSGDADNNAADSACGVEKYVIDLTPNPS